MNIFKNVPFVNNIVKTTNEIMKERNRLMNGLRRLRPDLDESKINDEVKKMAESTEYSYNEWLGHCWCLAEECKPMEWE